MKVLHRLKDYGLRLSPEKCHFFRSSVIYLGHVVGAQGVHTDPDKVSALKDWPRPDNTEVIVCKNSEICTIEVVIEFFTD